MTGAVLTSEFERVEPQFYRVNSRGKVTIGTCRRAADSGTKPRSKPAETDWGPVTALTLAAHP